MLSPIHNMEHLVSEIQDSHLVYAVCDYPDSSMVSVLLLSRGRMVEIRFPTSERDYSISMRLCRSDAGNKCNMQFYKKENMI